MQQIWKDAYAAAAPAAATTGIKYDHFAKKHMKQSQVARHWLKIHQTVFFHDHLINFLMQS